MASQRFILLVNNRVIRDDNNYPIFEVQEGGKKFYTNFKGDNDLEERVEEVIESITREEAENPLTEVVMQTRTLTRYIQDFKIKMFITPLYELQMQLAKSPDSMHIAGSNINIQEIWQKQLYEFYVVEFLKYTQIMDYLESIVRTRTHQMSPFTIRHKDNRVMSILHISVNGLFNPMDIVVGLKDTKLFKTIYGDGKLTSAFSLDDPAVFQVEIMRGSVTCYFATSSDILKMCNVKHKEAIASRDLYRLIAGIVLKNMFSGSASESLHQGILSFPVNKTLYRIIDPIDNVIVRYFEDKGAADNYADDYGYNVGILDTDANFIVSAFPSFKNKNITQETPLLHEIRGAEFVY